MAKTILIVDDDPEITSYLTTLFEDNGYDTVVANDGAKALELVQQKTPDLITLDIEMPEDWGPRFHRKLGQMGLEYKNIPVIVISGLTGNKYAVPKAVASFTKPFDREELLDTVNKVIG